MNTSRKDPRPRSPSDRGLARFNAGLLGISLLAAAMVLSACQASQATEEASPLPPEPTLTVVPPATETPLPTKKPTRTPTATPTPGPILGPEQPALSIEHVAGWWLMYILGRGEGDPAILTFAEDGTFSIDGIGGYHAGMNLGRGTYWFDGNVLSLYAENGCTTLTVDFFTCTGTYRVYFAMGEDGPGALRFVAIDDPHTERKASLINMPLYFATPVEE